MSVVLKDLFSHPPVKDFAKLFKQCEKDFADPQTFLTQVADYLPLRVYERYYDDEVPHALFGLAAAAESADLFPPDKLWWPFVQQSWFAAKTRKRSPWNLNGAAVDTGGTIEDRWSRFKQAAVSGDFPAAYALARTFLSSEKERADFRRRSLTYAMEDTAHGGLKYLYLEQSWSLAELIEWKSLEKVLFPALHFLVLGPSKTHIVALTENWKQTSAPKLSHNNGGLPDDLYPQIEHDLLYGDNLETAVKTVSRLADSGAGLVGAREALLLAGAQAIINSKAGSWVAPVRAFLFTYLIQRWMNLVDPGEQPRGLLISAGLICEASKESREQDTNRVVDELARRFCPTDTFNTLRSVVSHSDPYASVTAVYAILGMDDEKKDALFENLATLAAKNDGQQGLGYDLLLVKAAVAAYRGSTSEHRDRLPVACGFFLGRIQKSYELFGAYGT